MMRVRGLVVTALAGILLLGEVMNPVRVSATEEDASGEVLEIIDISDEDDPDEEDASDEEGSNEDIASEEEVTDEEELPKETTEEEDGVGAFVTRCYEVALSRQPDPSGYEAWTSRLKNGKACGAHVAFGFIFSPEYISRNKTDAEYVTDLYKMFFDREGEQGGYDFWMSKLQNGSSRASVFAGFANSQEFFKLCNRYGVTAGYYVIGVNNDTQGGVNCFVARLYKVCLGRNVDMAGQQYWVKKFINNEVQGDTGAAGFVFSQEYENKQLSNEEFVENLYLALFGREGDARGKAYWLMYMNYYNYDRKTIFYGFTMSTEFKELCKSYGIKATNQAMNKYTVRFMGYSDRWSLVTGGTATDLYSAFRSKEECEKLLTTISVKVWDFENSGSMNKVTKTLDLRVNKYLAGYYAQAFQEIYMSPDKPVIKPSGTYAYYYRQNVNNKTVLSTHSYGIAIDINPAYNQNGDPVKSYEEWKQMPEDTIAQKQAKAYTFHEDCTIVRIMRDEYSLCWGGDYSYTKDAMHFEFCN